MPEKIYRKNVAAIVINKDKKVLIAERSDFPNAFQFPQGGINEYESEEEAVLRELKEELGTDKFKIILKSNKTYKYNFPKEVKEKFNYTFGGQEQRFFLVRFLGNNDDINLNQSNNEFKSYKWVPFSKNISKNIIKFKRKVYDEIYNDFKSIISNLDNN